MTTPDLARPDLERLMREDARRQEARRLYMQSTLTVEAIMATLKMSSKTLYKLLDESGGPRRSHTMDRPTTRSLLGATEPPLPQQPVDIDRLKQRLFQALERNIDKMESRMTSENGAESADPERDIRAIGTAVRTVEKLHDIPGGTGRTDSPKSARSYLLTPEEEERLALEIAERIAKIVEREQSASGNPRGS